MSFEHVAIAVRGLHKRYEIYKSPRDRLLQLVVPPLFRLARRSAAVVGVKLRAEPPCYFRDFRALDGISFEVRRGETLGIIGRNGSGKSTLLQIIAGTLQATSGERVVNGRVAALLELGSGFNPEFTGRENVFLNGRILGLSHKEIVARFDDIVAFADIGEFIDQAVKTYSTGMFVRLAFAVQAHIDASIVIIDEALAVGDVFFRQKCYARLEQLRASGAAILLVSHSMPEIEQYCERALLLDHGTARFLGPAAEASKHYYLLDQGQRQSLPAYESEHATRGDSPLQAPIARPPAEAFLDLTRLAPVGNGKARCTAIAIADADNRLSRSFRQGDTVCFYFAFELTESIGVPICGVVISNERGVIVHGKNSWQSDNEVAASIGAGSKVICQQEIVLDLAPGEYVVEFGLAAISPADWARRAAISHDALHGPMSSFTRICHVPNATNFSVGFAQCDGVTVLTHHGIANLPGSIRIVTTP